MKQWQFDIVAACQEVGEPGNGTVYPMNYRELSEWLGVQQIYYITLTL